MEVTKGTATRDRTEQEFYLRFLYSRRARRRGKEMENGRDLARKTKQIYLYIGILERKGTPRLATNARR